MADSSPQGAPLDRYVVLEYLSEGGMGAIYVGKKLGAGGFEKQVVLKQLLPEFTSQPEFKDLFLREARLSATLDHANIVHTIDLVAAGEDYFIVMEYVPGADLRTLLKRAKRRRRYFSAAAAIYIATEVLSALAFAHAKVGSDGNHLGLIHRDVSPSNILVSHNGEVKLTDFGIAKASTHNSVFYRVKGKVGYMSPEQAKSQSLDHRSDLYSLAVCLYEMVCGERLFVHVGLTTSAEEIYSQPVPLVSRKVQGVPPEFDKVMLKALHIEPDYRYQTAGEFREALLRCAHRAGLMISAPELATHLRESCGDPARWRDADEDEGEDNAPAREGEGTEVIGAAEGTEVLDPTEEEEIDEKSDLDFVSIGTDSHSLGPVVNERQRRESRSRSSMFDLGRLRNMELTSMISLAALESHGHQPLVDLDDLGTGAAQPAPMSPSIDTGGFEITSVVLGRGNPAPGPVAWQTTSNQVALGGLGPSLEGLTGVYPVRPAEEPRVGGRAASRVLLILALILLLGIVAAAIVGLSGPKIEEKSPTDPSRPGAQPIPDETPSEASGEESGAE